MTPNPELRQALDRIHVTRQMQADRAGRIEIVLTAKDYQTLYSAALHAAAMTPTSDETEPGRAAPDDPVSPSYYERGGISFAAIADAWELTVWRAFAVKYLLRAGLKGSALEDLKKARWCLDHEIGRLEARP